VLALAALVLPVRVAAQQPPPPPAPPDSGTIGVFLDCQTWVGCDLDHARREIPYVNWMRDRRDADVHVLVTAQETGGGGYETTLTFIGLRRFAEQADTLRHVSRNTDTDAEIREEVTRLLKLGLTRFLLRTGVAPRLDLAYRPPAEGAQLAASPASDPWNFWTFRIRAGGYFSGERQQSSRSLNGSVSANRTTDALKIELGLYGNASRGAFTLSDSSEYVSTSESYSADLLTVWSLGDHWSLGGTASADRSTYSNLDLGIFAGPAIEYDIFPYGESTRKKLTVMYSVELAYFNYEEITVTGRMSETRPRHRLQIGAQVQQPWGQIFGSVSGTQYLYDPSVHRIDTFAGFTFRIFRGLELNVFGSFARIKDQFGLPAEGLSDEEILLQRRALETDYRYSTNFSLSYRFGSKFANVVNPRMGGGSFMIMF
ncbi:MAG: DUF481 domain-containing protein, partial [Gemmatimonadales bacterium]|nr:DUF481 domain-containing protein [Gemmatimonadales bacterium]